MSSLTLTDEQLARKYGRRPTGVTSLDEPQELGYICPKGHGGGYLTWSEFKEHIWCHKCQVDYHYATDCKLRRMCWMSDKQWEDFVARLPMEPVIVGGIQHFSDCKIPHRKRISFTIKAKAREGEPKPKRKRVSFIARR